MTIVNRHFVIFLYYAYQKYHMQCHMSIILNCNSMNRRHIYDLDYCFELIIQLTKLFQNFISFFSIVPILNNEKYEVASLSKMFQTNHEQY